MSHSKKNRKNKLPQSDIELPESNKMLKRQSLEMYSGPLPKPDDLIKYNQAYPDAAKIILEGFQKQSEHRMELEKIVVSGNSRRANRGQLFAFILAVVIICFGGTLLLLGKELEGYVLLVGTVSTLIGIFLYGRKTEKKERIEKFQNLLKPQ